MNIFFFFNFTSPASFVPIADETWKHFKSSLYCCPRDCATARGQNLVARDDI